MVESDRAISFSLSIYESDLEKANQFAKKHPNLRTQAEVFRCILQRFFKYKENEIKKDLIFYFVYPVIFGALISFYTLMTQRLINILSEKGLFFAELLDLNRISVIFGALVIGIIVAGIYVLRKKWYE